LLLGIGAADHIVAICDLDEDIGPPEAMPHIGDFDHVDWEKLAAVHPNILVTQFGGRTPPGLQQRCDELKIRVVDIKLDVLDDIYAQAEKLANLLGEQDNQRRAVADLQHRLSALAAASANFQPQRTAITMSEGGAMALLGPGS